MMSDQWSSVAVFRKFLSRRGQRSVITVLALCGLCWFMIPFQGTYATTYAHVFVSLERKFIGSSFVFVGIPERSGYDVPIKVTQVYKPPKEGLPESAQVIVSGDYVDAGKEYLFFGHNTQVDDSWFSDPVVKTAVSAFRTADYQIAELRRKKKNPSLFSNNEPPVIFIGRVAQNQQWADIGPQRTIDGVDAVLREGPYARAIVEFEIREVFRQAPVEGKNTTQELQESQRASVFVGTCGDGFQLGHSYLVFARYGASPTIPGTPPNINDVHYRSQCRESANINEKAILAKLAERHKAR